MIKKCIEFLIILYTDLLKHVEKYEKDIPIEIFEKPIYVSIRTLIFCKEKCISFYGLLTKIIILNMNK